MNRLSLSSMFGIGKEKVEQSTLFSTFLRNLKQNERLETEYIKRNLKQVLNEIIEKQQQDIALEIIELLGSNQTYIENYMEFSDVLSTIDGSYLEKLLGLFKNNQEVYALKAVKALIKLLRTELHQKLSLINTLLQIIECGFKHGESDIKALSYDCWTSLIENFALDKKFLLHSKKLNLVMVPFLNKCKSYREETVSIRKVLSWLSLIQHVNVNILKCYLQVLIPFFNYCFGLQGDSLLDEYQDNDDDDLKRFLDLKLTPAHNNRALNQIGGELLLVFVMNDNHEKIADLKSNFSYVDTAVNYEIRDTLTEKKLWLCLIKYFFDVYLQDKAAISEQITVDAWECLSDLSALSYANDDDSRQYQVEKSISKYFFSKSIDLINSSSEQANKVDELFKRILASIKSHYSEYFSGDSDMKNKATKALEKLSSTLLKSDENFFTNINSILDTMKTNVELVELFAWLKLATKLTDYLRHPKLKNSKVLISRSDLESIDSFVTFPYKYFKLLDNFYENYEAKINACVNLVKTFSSQFKQDRIGVSSYPDFNINEWCSNLFRLLNDPSSDLTMTSELIKHWTSQPKSSSNQMIESTLSFLLIYTELVLFMIQNVMDFEAINMPSNASFTFHLNKMDRVRSYELFTNVVDLTRMLIDLFYKFVMSFSNGSVETDANKNAMKIETKQPVLIFVSLIDIIYMLFNRVKSNEILTEFLTHFSGSIEQLSQLSEISRKSAQIPKRSETPSKISSHNPQIVISLQASRKSNELFEAMAIQIVSHIQNNFTNMYTFEQFDTGLLDQLEPIFYSFLAHSSKYSIRQKTLQAWNATFGKSTASSLGYSSRLEKLFIELREEMLANSKQKQASSAGLVLLLPCFKPMDSLLNQSTNATNPVIINECATPVEKENNTSKRAKIAAKNHEDFVNIYNETSLSESIPIVKPVTIEKPSTTPQIAAPTIEFQMPTNFVFSPIVGKNSTYAMKCHSASKLDHKNDSTPEQSSKQAIRASPRSVSQASKRKLDLNSLIDQMPDNEFIPIQSVSVSKLGDKRIASVPKRARRPLTEHQKEMRTRKSFIPLEIQSIVNNADSQMSCSQMDEDTSTQPTFPTSTSFSIAQQNLKEKNATQEVKTNEEIKSEVSFIKQENELETVDVESEKIERNQEQVKEKEKQQQQQPTGQICFQSKKDPNKQIQLFEVSLIPVQVDKQVEIKSPEVEVGEKQEDTPSSVAAKVEDDNSDNISEAPIVETPLKRRSSLRINSQKAKDMNSSNLAKPDSTGIQEQSNEHNLSHEILISLPHVIAKINEDKPAVVSPASSSLSLSERKALKKQLKRNSLPKMSTKKKQGILKTSRASLKLKMRKSNLSEPKKLLLIKNLSLVAARNNESHVKRRSLPIIKQSDKKPIPTEKIVTTTTATKAVEPEPQPIKDEKQSNQDEDDLPLSKLIEIMRTEVKDEAKKEEIKEEEKKPMTSEEAATKAANNRLSTTIDELMHKLNNTPTTSILKRKLLSQVGEVPASPNPVLSISFSTEITENNTPTKRRVSFCESVRIEEIEPNLNKSLFRSTSRLQNKPKFFISPFSSQQKQQALMNNVPAARSTTIEASSEKNGTSTSNITVLTASTTTSAMNMTTSTIEVMKSPVRSAVLSNVLGSGSPKTLNSLIGQAKSSPSVLSLRHGNESSGLLNQLSPTKTQSSPSSSLIDHFFSSNKENLILSQRIHQQMSKSSLTTTDSAPASPQVASQSPKNLVSNMAASQPIDLAVSPSALFDSPKSISAATSTEPTLDTPQSCGYPKLKHSKLPLDILFDQIDTSLYLNKIGSYKFFRFKNILTLGELCSLSSQTINSFPFKAPKFDNYLCMIRSFEEKCPDKIRRYETTQSPNIIESKPIINPPIVISDKPVVSNQLMGSVEEEMDKLESNSSNLDVSIECEPTTVVEVSQNVEVSEKTVEKPPSPVKEDQPINNSDLIKSKLIELEDFFKNVDLKEKTIDDLFELSDAIDLAKNNINNCVYNLQVSIRKMIKDKTTK